MSTKSLSGKGFHSLFITMPKFNEHSPSQIVENLFLRVIEYHHDHYPNVKFRLTAQTHIPVGHPYKRSPETL